MSDGATLRLLVRTPVGVIVDADVGAIRAEDESGWFGIRPGREDVVAILPPGLLLATGVRRLRGGDLRGPELYVAVGAGLLSLAASTCTVLVQSAAASSVLDDVDDALALEHQRRAARAETQRDVVHRLASEALRRLVQQVRT